MMRADGRGAEARRVQEIDTVADGAVRSALRVEQFQ